MRKLWFVFICACGVMLSGCLDSAPKCNDETVVDSVKEILLRDKWFFVENGFTKETLMAMAMENLTFEKIDMVTELGFVDVLKPVLDLKDYSHKASRISSCAISHLSCYFPSIKYGTLKHTFDIFLFHFLRHFWILYFQCCRTIRTFTLFANFCCHKIN